jgi:hypothetical protein
MRNTLDLFKTLLDKGLKVISIKYIRWHDSLVTRENRETQNGHKSVILWFTDLSGAGKSILAHAVEKIT